MDASLMIAILIASLVSGLTVWELGKWGWGLPSKSLGPACFGVLAVAVLCIIFAGR